MFDATSDTGIAKEVPEQAYRRFRNDLHARKQRNLSDRAAQMELHEQKKAAAVSWLAAHGSVDQRARAAAGVLALQEIVAAMTDEAFAAVADVPQYERDGATRLETYLRATLGAADLSVAPADLKVESTDATSATAGQWQVMSTLQTKLPDAIVKLREHRLVSMRHTTVPPLSIYGVLVTRKVGPFNLRREFAAPGGSSIR